MKKPWHRHVFHAIHPFPLYDDRHGAWTLWLTRCDCGEERLEIDR